MKNEEFDLDVTFDGPEPDLSGFSAAAIASAIENLAEPLKGVATGILVEKRTMSDVSQALGIRQAELVARLHRAKIALATELG